MSDILTSYSSCVLDDQIANDNLVEFLTKLARFGIEQCLRFAHLIVNKQRLIENSSTLNDKSIQLNHLSIEIQRLQNDFSELLSTISLSDDSTKQLLFIKLQNNLSNFVDINLRFKSIDCSIKEFNNNNIKQSIKSVELPTSSSFYSTDDINDIGKYWKFANIIHTRFEMSLIASNSQEILCYNNQNNFLHILLITGQFQRNIKWKYNPIIDILWCSLIDRYIAVTHHSVYTIQYNRTKSLISDAISINNVLDLTKFHSIRIACNENNILFYITNQQSSSIEIYDNQFKLIKTFSCSINNSQSFCCTNTLIALTEKDQVLVSHFPYVTPKKISLLLFDIDTFELQYTIDLNDCSQIYTMKSLEQDNVFFALTDEKLLWIIQIDNNQIIQMAKKTFYTNQTEMCVMNNRDLFLINVNAGHAIQLIKYRKIKQ